MQRQQPSNRRWVSNDLLRFNRNKSEELLTKRPMMFIGPKILLSLKQSTLDLVFEKLSKEKRVTDYDEFFNLVVFVQNSWNAITVEDNTTLGMASQYRLCQPSKDFIDTTEPDLISGNKAIVVISAPKVLDAIKKLHYVYELFGIGSLRHV